MMSVYISNIFHCRLHDEVYKGFFSHLFFHIFTCTVVLEDNEYLCVWVNIRNRIYTNACTCTRNNRRILIIFILGFKNQDSLIYSGVYLQYIIQISHLLLMAISCLCHLLLMTLVVNILKHLNGQQKSILFETLEQWAKEDIKHLGSTDLTVSRWCDMPLKRDSSSLGGVDDEDYTSPFSEERHVTKWNSFSRQLSKLQTNSLHFKVC